jgi:hypothetical protein
MAAHHEPSSQDNFSEERHKSITACFRIFDPDFRFLMVEDHVVATTTTLIVVK